MTRDNLILDRYEPLGTAGTGGFGTVEIAWDPRIQRKVAIKTIKLTELDAARAALPGAQAVASPNTAERWHGVVPWNEYLAEETDEASELAEADKVDKAHEATEQPEEPSEQVTSLAHLPGLDEARTAAMLADPRIVTVYDFEVRGRYAYLIMEYVEGITLTKLLSDYPNFLTLDMVAAVFDAVAGALTAAHDAGVLHLDIKPDNILINPQGQVKVTDFGLATLSDASGAGTTGGGTIGYMPLEQMRREHLDARTDEWSLASVAYEMLTGSNPFRVRTLDEAEAAIENAELVLPSLCWEKLDEQADDVVFYALDPDRGERYESVADFAEELDKFLGDAKEGTEQLALVVEDALGLNDTDDIEVNDESWEENGTSSRDTQASKAGLFRRIACLLPAGGSKTASTQNSAAEAASVEDAYYEESEIGDDYPEEKSASTQGTQKPAWKKRSEAKDRRPLSDRVSGRGVAIAACIFAAAASGFIAYFALSNMQILSAGFGPGTQYVIAALSVVVAVLGAIRSHLGAFAAFCLLGVALILCGNPVAGAILLVATVLWWYIVGHEGKAAANVALLLPVLGAVGGSSAVPLLAGLTLKPFQAVITTAFCIICAFALGLLGTASLLGWDALAHWNFSRIGFGSSIIAMASNPATWTTAAGWLASSTILSLLRQRDSRLLSMLGIALALVALLLGSLVFADPSPQLIVPAILASIVALVKLMNL